MLHRLKRIVTRSKPSLGIGAFRDRAPSEEDLLLSLAILFGLSIRSIVVP
jgi:hypothetical protein